jgi:hypothetical protein
LLGPILYNISSSGAFIKAIKLIHMRWIFILLVFLSMGATAQWKDYMIGARGDTLNKIDLKGKKQGAWINKFETLRGEPGFEEEGEYLDDRKEGNWRKFNLMGDLVAIENFHWGFLDGNSQYFNLSGNIIREESWRAFNPDKAYDTLAVEDVTNLGTYNDVIIKNEGSSLKHGTWSYYSGIGGAALRTEFYRLGKLEQGSADPPSLGKDTMAVTSNQKPKEVLDYEKRNSGKKKIKVRDGTVRFNQ